MKTSKLFFGLSFLLAGALLILDAVGVIAPLVGIMGEVSVFAIFFGVLLIAFIVNRLFKRKFTHIFFPLAFLFMLFERNIATVAGLPSTDIISNWLVLAIALLFTLGFGLLISAAKQRERSLPMSERNHAGGALGSYTVYVNSETLRPQNVENNMGSCVVHFEAPECYVGGGTLRVENNMGSMVIYVPAKWHVHTSIENNLGSVNAPARADNHGPLLNICGENNLGSVSIRYV